MTEENTFFSERFDEINQAYELKLSLAYENKELSGEKKIKDENDVIKKL